MQHDSFLRRYQETNEPHIIGRSGRSVPELHKSGKVIPLSLKITESIIDDCKYFFSEMVDMTELSANIIIDDMGVIQNCNQDFLVMFGYGQQDELVGKNISTIMPSPYSQFHESVTDLTSEVTWNDIVRLVLDSSSTTQREG